VINLNAIKSTPNRICSIDASTNSLAFAIFDKNSLESFGKINFEGSSVYKKIINSSKKTKAFFESYGSFDAVIIEHTVFINSPKTAADLALVQGSILGAMSLTGVKEIRSINPIAWQTFIGNGRLSVEEKQSIRSDSPNKSDSWYKSYEREVRKQKTIRFINTYYDRQVSDNDVADAIGIGHYAVNNWARLA